MSSLYQFEPRADSSEGEQVVNETSAGTESYLRDFSLRLVKVYDNVGFEALSRQLLLLLLTIVTQNVFFMKNKIAAISKSHHLDC